MKILVCSDGSIRAWKELDFAGILAKATGAAVTILGLTEEQAEAVPKPLLQGRRSLEQKDISTELIVKYGEPLPEIVNQTKQDQYDIVVTGVERRAGHGFYLRSAKIYSIGEAISSPLLMVPEFRPEIKRILLCSGGGTYIDNAVKFVGPLARACGASVTILNILAEPPAMHARLVSLEEDVRALLNSNCALSKNLKHAKSVIEQSGAEADIRIRHGIVISEILNEANESNCDLIVAGSYPVPDPWRDYVIGNVTRKIINRADRPVLIIRSDKKPVSLAKRLRQAVTQFGTTRGD
jgi:nucleotide-binding universal stress UspA family protein